MNPLEQSYYDSMFAARYPMPVPEPKAPAYAAAAVDAATTAATAEAKTIGGHPDAGGSVKPIERNLPQQAIGRMGQWIESLATQLDKFGITIKVPGTDATLNPTLKDITVGDMGRVLEDISYGFYPVTGKGTTTGLKPEAVELMNLPILAAPLAAAGKGTAKAAAGVAGLAASSAAGGDKPKPGEASLKKVDARKRERTIKYDSKGKRELSEGARG